MKSPILILLLLIGANLAAQNFSENYTPFRDKFASKEYIDSIIKKFPIEEATINEKNKNLRKEIISLHKENREYYTQLANSKLIFTKDTITRFLQSVADEIISRNPHFRFNRIVVNTYRTDEPNASDLGNGLILFNLNLIPFLKSEDELAFIMAHEIGHDYMEHVLKGQKKRHELLTNKEFQKKLSAAQKQEYNSVAAVESLYYTYLGRYFKNSRVNELQADSFAIELLKNTKYSPASSVGALGVLDSIEHRHMNFPIDYKGFFNFTGLPFQQSWLEEDGNPLTNTTRETLADSLKSHPDCDIRIEIASALLASSKTHTIQNHSQPGFQTIKNLVLFELIEFYQGSEDYGRGLYYCINLLKKFPDNRYLKISTGVFLAEIQRALIDHRFTMVVDRENNYYPESYNFFIKFLNNLTSNNYKQIIYHYCKDHLSKLPPEEYLDYCYTLCDTNLKTETEKLATLKKFADIYQNSYYYKLLNQKLQKNETKN